MQRILRILVIIGLVVPSLSLGVVAAETGNTTTTETTMAQRLAQHKTEFKLKLTRTQLARLKLKCKAAQGVVSSLNGRIKGIETSRAAVYTNLNDHLTTLKSKLQIAGVDTTELEAEITALQAKIDTYKTDMAAYKQSAADLTSMDCRSDPTAFKATLLATRAAHDKVGTDIKAIHDYLTGTIKPTLVAIRQQLETKEKTTSQD